MNKMNKVLKNKKGFTMIELIIVIAIIVILAAIAIPTFTGFIESANSSAATSEARNVYLAAKVEAVDAEIDGTAFSDISDATIESEAGVTSGSVTNVTINSTSDINFTYTSDSDYVVLYEDGAFVSVTAP